MIVLIYFNSIYYSYYVLWPFNEYIALYHISFVNEKNFSL